MRIADFSWLVDLVSTSRDKLCRSPKGTALGIILFQGLMQSEMGLKKTWILESNMDKL